MKILWLHMLYMLYDVWFSASPLLLHLCPVLSLLGRGLDQSCCKSPPFCIPCLQTDFQQSERLCSVRCPVLFTLRLHKSSWAELRPPWSQIPVRSHCRTTGSIANWVRANYVKNKNEASYSWQSLGKSRGCSSYICCPLSSWSWLQILALLNKLNL